MTPECKIENGRLVITMPVFAEPVPSKSGKSRLVATTHGCQPCELLIDGEPLILNVSAFLKNKGE